MTSLWRIVASDDHRYGILMTLAAIAWTVTVLVVLLRFLEVVPTQWTSLAVLSTGLGVASSLALNRLKLADTILAVFRAGAASAEDRRESKSDPPR